MRIQPKHEEEVEEWRPVVGYEGYYEVSSFGNVASLGFRKHGRYPHRRRLLTQSGVGPRKNYRRVNLYKDRKQKGFFTHLVVMAAFVGPVPQSLECAHLDGNPSNNHLSNLRYVTHKENISHKWLHGTQLTKLTRREVRAIKAMAAWGIPKTEIAPIFSVHRTAVGLILSGKTWFHPSIELMS